MAKKIVFTGGGTAGHVIPNIPLMEKCVASGFEVSYIGGYNSFEENFVPSKGFKFTPIYCDKLRRQMTFKHILAPVKIVFGIYQTIFHFMRERPNLVFSKGGYVAFPVCLSAYLLQIPVIVHESDLTPGLANKLCFRFAKYICTTWEQTVTYIDKYKKKTILTGMPIRKEIKKIAKNMAKEFLGFADTKPLILVFGGSLGSESINQLLLAALPKLVENYNIVHICGKGNIPEFRHVNYRAFEYLDKEFPSILAAADLIISRAGAGTVYEILYLNKPAILIPLSKATRGDQIANAKALAEKNMIVLLDENDASSDVLSAKIDEAFASKSQLTAAMQSAQVEDGTDKIFGLFLKELGL